MVYDAISGEAGGQPEQGCHVGHLRIKCAEGSTFLKTLVRKIWVWYFAQNLGFLEALIFSENR